MELKRDRMDQAEIGDGLSVQRPNFPPAWVWLGLSLGVALWYSLWAMGQGFVSPQVIQDDARQHVFWMQRFVDPELFPKDLIADYFQSVAPWGYSKLYQGAAALGVEPLLLHKLLPPVLGAVMTAYCFGFVAEWLPLAGVGPLAGFVAAVLLNQNLWMQDGLISATPKAFLYPTFLPFLYYLARRSLWPCLVTIVLQALFYPLCVFLSAGVLALGCCQWVGGRLRWAPRRSLLFCCLGLAVAVAAMLPYVLESSSFGPTINATQARSLPEFLAGNRSSFFHDHDPWRFWVNAGRSSLRIASALMPLLTYTALLLPWLLRWPQRFPLAAKLSAAHSVILPQLLAASLFWFFAAHALLFKLHLPSRYTQHSFRIVAVMAAAIALTLLLDALWQGRLGSGQWLRAQPTQRRGAIALVSLLFGLLLLGYPLQFSKFPRTGYVVGTHPQLYEFLQQQPKTSLIASLAGEANNLPSFAQRSVLVADEYAIPYHLGYYRPFRQRSIDLLTAQYTPDLAQLQTFIRRYNISHWLLDSQSFSPDFVRDHDWFRAFPTQRDQAIAHLQSSQRPALQRLQPQCRIFAERDVEVLDATCLLQAP